MTDVGRHGLKNNLEVESAQFDRNGLTYFKGQISLEGCACEKNHALKGFLFQYL